MERRQDPVWGSIYWECRDGHRHAVEARARACEAKPSQRRTAALLFGEARVLGPEARALLARAAEIARGLHELGAPPEGVVDYRVEDWLEGLAFGVVELNEIWRRLENGELEGLVVARMAYALESRHRRLMSEDQPLARRPR